MTTDKELSGNKGEWSEFYTFCYLLDSGKLVVADRNLEPSDDTYLPIVKIIRPEKGKMKGYVPDGEKDIVEITMGEEIIDTVPKSEFRKTLKVVYDKSVSGSGVGAFSIPEIVPFLKKIYCDKIKADPLHKEDINIQLFDINTGQKPIQGFSIKSYIGNDPTLLNAGKTTNFRFKIEDCSDELMNKINAIETRTKIVDRMDLLTSQCRISFDRTEDERFEKNLRMVDSSMPEIVSELLLIHYTKGIVRMTDAVKELEKRDPLKMDIPGFYEYKVKSLLRSIALGMIPSEPWHGKEDANGGYIVVKDNGDVVCFFLYNRNEFEQYLLDCTKFERASTTRHDYLRVYESKGDYYIDLNLQIRFFKPGYVPRNQASTQRIKTFRF